ncbi:MAG: AMP-binding protein, partial [Planctomycetota bacterium]
MASQFVADGVAVAAPKSKRQTRPIAYSEISFSQLEQRSNQIALGLAKHGVVPGTRIALMVPPGIEFVSLVF